MCALVQPARGILPALPALLPLADGALPGLQGQADP